jgi:fatty-acyl-CoA synthase
MIKTGGENVASREIEEAIYQLLGVSEVAVIGVSHPRWIEAVVSVIVLKTGILLAKEKVLLHCGQRLAPFKVPKEVIFTEALPKNPSGKIIKRELRRDHANLFEQSFSKIM